jgi:manganese/zinc/iron transport system substrate-binding protein
MQNLRLNSMFLRLILICLGVVWVSACQEGGGSSDVGASGKPLVVTTVTMVTDLVQEVGGDRVEVRGLMGPGVDPHNYQPRIGDSGLLEKATAIFYCGLHLEGKMQESLERLAKRKPHVYAVSSGIPETMLLEPQEDFEGHFDPHVWGDPALWLETVDVVVKGLSEVDPEGAAIYQERGEEYKSTLSDLKSWAMARVAEVPAQQRVLVTSHDAFFYFGKGFGFEVRGLQGVSTVSEAGLRDRDNLVKYIKERKIRTVFGETSVNGKAIAVVAKDAGVAVSPEELFSDAMGTPGDVVEFGGESYDKGTYVGMVKHNVNAIVEGLK